jgi:hypothetical protein
MRDHFDFDIVAKRLNAFTRRFDITNSFTDVNENCDARHTSLLCGGLPSAHESTGAQ